MPKRKLFSWTVLIRGFILIAWMAIIFAFSAMPGSPYPPVEPTLGYFLERKGAHVIEYAVLMFLAVRFFYVLAPKDRLRDILTLAAVLSLAYGVTDELHQSFVSNRGSKVTDVLIDGIGVVLTALFFWAAAPSRKLRKPKSGKQKKT